MKDLELYVETLSNKFDLGYDEFCERDEYDTGYVEGWEHACHSILTYMEKNQSSTAIPPAKHIYEALKDIRYDKNASGAFSSACLKDEFTDYALRDIAVKLHTNLIRVNQSEAK